MELKQIKVRVIILRTQIEKLIKEEQEVAQEFEPILRAMLVDGEKEEATRLVNEIYTPHKIFHRYFTRLIQES